MNLRNDERGIIVGWLTKLVLGFIIAAVVMYDAGSIMVNFFTLDSTADDIAVSLSISLSGTQRPPTQQELEEEAQDLARASGARLLAAELEQDGTVRIRIRRRASTLVVQRIGPISDWARATAEGEAGRGTF